jgi:hypothetical protein|tara:strand:- start:3289 stop:4002 length:714 start_codon:yes stop_codon:yes gene_type:complete
MPITQKDDKWYWGGQGPFNTKTKATEVAQAAYASGYSKSVQKFIDFQKEQTADLILPRGETKILQAEDDNYKRGLLVELLEDGGYDVAYWYDEFTVYPVEVLVDGESVKKDAKKVTFKYHPELNDKGDVKPNEEKSIEKEEGGLAGGGTVFTSTNAGIFTPTYGGRYPTRKKKKTGIEKLGLFVNENSPQKKMEKAWGSGGVQADELARSGKMDTLEPDEERNEPEVQHLEENKKKS